MSTVIENLINRTSFISKNDWLEGFLCAKTVCFENSDYNDWFISVLDEDPHISKTESDALEERTKAIIEYFETTGQFICFDSTPENLHEDLIRFSEWGDGFIMGFCASYPHELLQNTIVTNFLQVILDLIRLGSSLQQIKKEELEKKEIELSLEDFRNLIEFCNDGIINCRNLLEETNPPEDPIRH